MANDQAAFNSTIREIQAGTIGHRVSFPMMGLDDDDACVLAEALKGSTTVTNLSLNWNLIGDRGIAAIGEMLLVNESILELELVKNNFGDAGAIALAEGIFHHRNLGVLEVRDNNLTWTGKDAIARAIILGDLRNVTIKPFDHTELQDYCSKNFNEARDVLLIPELPEILSPKLLHCAAERWHAVQRAHEGKEILDELKSRIAQLPKPDVSQPDAVSALMAQQGDYRAIDNPSVWWNLDETLAEMNQANLRLQADELLDSAGNPTEILERAIGCGNVRHLFTYENWQGATKAELKSVFDALPDYTFIPNRTQLLTTISREEKQAARGR